MTGINKTQSNISEGNSVITDLNNTEELNKKRVKDILARDEELGYEYVGYTTPLYSEI